LLVWRLLAELLGWRLLAKWRWLLAVLRWLLAILRRWLLTILRRLLAILRRWLLTILRGLRRRHFSIPLRLLNVRVPRRRWLLQSHWVIVLIVQLRLYLATLRWWHDASHLARSRLLIELLLLGWSINHLLLLHSWLLDEEL
jgi:hypothetical protein